MDAKANQPGPQAVAVTTDLIFSSKISGTGAALGIETLAVSTTAALTDWLDRGGVRLVMVDMGLPRQTACDALQQAATHPSRPVSIAFYSHVEPEAAEAARQAGASMVLPRSKFSSELPDILRRFCLATPE